MRRLHIDNPGGELIAIRSGLADWAWELSRRGIEVRQSADLWRYDQNDVDGGALLDPKGALRSVLVLVDALIRNIAPFALRGLASARSCTWTDALLATVTSAALELSASPACVDDASAAQAHQRLTAIEDRIAGCTYNRHELVLVIESVDHVALVASVSSDRDRIGRAAGDSLCMLLEVVDWADQQEGILRRAAAAVVRARPAS